MNALVKYHSRSFAILCFLFLQLQSAGQTSTNFTASPVSGCAPIVVKFTDASTGSPTQWKWDLGNGVTSILQNPSATYFNPGKYTIKLVTTTANGQDSLVKTDMITVYANPSVQFTASDTSGCFPLQVKFTDRTTTTDGTITSWNWDFGDGSVSTEQHPSHTYTAFGNFSVILKVTNSFGCTKTFTKSQYIKTSGGVNASFTTTGGISCAAPASVVFNNTSTGSASNSYLWSFGDGSTSTDLNPVHSYSTAGAYVVTLVGTTPGGCRDTFKVTNGINIGSFTSRFTNPDTICTNQPITFTNTSATPPSASLWSFGDGTISNVISPTKTYTTSGTYSVKVVNTFGSCLDSFTKSIVVSPKPQLSFTVSSAVSCKAPVTAIFTSQVSPGASLLWNFGDGTTSTEANPVHTYNNNGSFTVTLIATNPSGCSDSLVKQNAVAIKKPAIEVVGFPVKGCAPQTATPSINITSGEVPASYLWNFGDGTTSTSATPSHTYSTPGKYTVSVAIVTTSGCTDTIVLVDGVKVGAKPKADFVVNPKDVCAFQAVDFKDASTGKPDQWLWDFGDGGTSTSQNPHYEYSDTGWFDVQVIIWSNSCPDTLIVNKAVHVKPPIAAFNIKFDCTDKFRRDFKDKSIGAETWLWSFGDGTTDTTKSPSHTYNKTGTYEVILTVTNGTCSHTKSQQVKIINEKADFTADSIVCRNVPIKVLSNNITASNIAGWEWNFGDGTIITDSLTATHAYTKPGTYTISLKITDKVGCTDSTTRVIKVFGPTANFKPTVSTACLYQNTISFTDSSSSDGTHPITKSVWNYGDGTIDSAAVAPYKHIYSTAGSYAISLTVTDSYGCTDNKSQPGSVVITQPTAAFTAVDTVSCTGKNINFINGSTGNNLQYQWNLGDGSSSTQLNPVHPYATVGSFTVNLIVTDANGCKDSLKKKDYLTISYPKARFNLSDSFATCPPLMVNFTNKSTDFTALSWNFGDGTASTIADPSHYYTNPGTYFAVLVVQGPGGCIDSIKKKIVIKGPSGSFTYAPLSGCSPLKVNFTAITKNTSSYIWDFSDGSTLNSTDSVTSHTYSIIGQYVPKLILVDPGGCTVPIIGTETISVKGAKTSFTLSSNQFCDNGQVKFNNTSAGTDSIVSYLWKFGDGTTSTDVNPIHSYAAPGNYSVQLTATTQLGCKDSTTLKDTVQVHVKPVISIIGDSVACAPATLTFNGIVTTGVASEMKWEWNLGNGKTSNIQNPLPLFYPKETSEKIIATVTDKYGCKDTAGKSLTINPLPATDAGPDRWICRGSTTQLVANGADQYQWRNSLSCATCPGTSSPNNVSGLSCFSCATPLAAPVDSSVFVLKGTNQFGCVREDSVTVRVRQPFVLKVGPGDTLCYGATTHLKAEGADQYIWSPAIGVTDPASGLTVVKPEVSTTYHLVAKDKYDCFTDSASVYVKVWPIPKVDANADVNLIVGKSVQLHTTNSNDVATWQWTPAVNLTCSNCPEPKASPRQTTTYNVEVKNGGGCKNNAKLTIYVTCNNGNVFLPNTFSPNTDGVNDKFYPRGSGIAAIKSLRIFNRWGEVVYERINFNVNDASLGWDGMYKGQLLSPDVYIYTCEVICQNNELLSFKGDVSLIR